MNCIYEDCGKPIPEKRLQKKAKYCTDRCREKHHAAKIRELSWGECVPDLTPSERGGVSELLASADLVMRGYEVYRSVTADSSCDLIALRRDGRAIKVEVRTGSKFTNGNVYCQKHGSHDVVAVVVVPERRVIYVPPLDEV